VVQGALEVGMLCSNNPICAQYGPSNSHERRFLYRAACHGCLLISETSCVQQNNYLNLVFVYTFGEDATIKIGGTKLSVAIYRQVCWRRMQCQPRHRLRDDIRDARAAGAVPVLVTPLPQRQYKDGKHVRTLEDYAAAMRAVGKESNTVVLDLNAEANAALDAMTEDQAHAFNNNPADPSVPGRDTTHLNAKGGEFFGAMVAREFAAAFPAVKVNTR
jgi:hypothetical protein